MKDRDKIIEVLKRHCHPMAGHDWLIGIDNSDFEAIADELLEQPESKGDYEDIKSEVNNAIEGYFARRRQSAKHSIELKNSIWQIFYKRDFYAPATIQPAKEQSIVEEWIDKNVYFNNTNISEFRKDRLAELLQEYAESYSKQKMREVIKSWCKFLYKNEDFEVDDKIIDRYLKTNQ